MSEKVLQRKPASLGTLWWRHCLPDAKQSSELPSSLLRDHRPDAAAEDQVDGAGAGREHHSGAAVVVGHAAGHRPAAGGPPVPPAALPCRPDRSEL